MELAMSFGLRNKTVISFDLEAALSAMPWNIESKLRRFPNTIFEFTPVICSAMHSSEVCRLKNGAYRQKSSRILDNSSDTHSSPDVSGGAQIKSRLPV
jgi:hypothetical protein